jgi:hypothetical protein
MFGSVRAFEMKLKLFRELLENVSFSSCDLVHKGGPVSVPFPSVLAVEMIHSMAENFQMRFTDFHSHAINIRKVSKVVPVLN